MVLCAVLSVLPLDAVEGAQASSEVATCISGLHMVRKEYSILCSIEKSLQNIFQHLENARLSLIEQNLPESHSISTFSNSDTVAQESVPCCCYCKNRKRSTDYNISSESSNNSSILSYLSNFPERTTWQTQSNIVPDSLEKELPMSRNRSTPLPTFQLTDTEKSDLFQNFAVLPPLQAHRTSISSNLQSLDPLVRGELEEHMSQKVSTLQKQVVPLPVKKSWKTFNHLMDVQGVSEQEIPHTQLPTPIPQSTKPSTNRSSDVPSIHLHVNIGANSEVNRTEGRMSRPLTSNKQLESENDHQIIRYNPLVISMDAPSSRNVEVNTIQEETTLLKKDPRHMLELNIEQRVIGLSEERIKSHKAQGTNVELTPKEPCSATDRIKVNLMALLQVMDLMGIIPDSHSEVTDPVGKTKDKTDLSQPSNQAELVSIPPKTSNPVIESTNVVSPQHHTRESKIMTSKPNQITNISKETPVALFHIMDSRGLINELCSNVIESTGITPKPQHQVMESVEVDRLHNKHQAIEPAKINLGPHHTVFKAGETIPKFQNKVTETLNMDPGSQNQATKQIRFTPSSLQPPQPPSKVLDSRVIPDPSEKSIHALKGNSVVQGSPTEMITPLQAGLTAQSVAQAKESPDSTSESQETPQG